MRSDYTTVTLDELHRLGELIATPTIVINRHEILYLNAAFTALTGYDDGDAPTLKFEDVIDPLHINDFVDMFEKILADSSLKSEQEVHIKTKYGDWLWLDFSSKLIMCSDEVYLMINLMDITEKKRMQFELARYLDLRDAMLEVSQFVIKSGDIELLYKMILSKAVSTIANAQVGSILLLDGDELKLSAYQGFDKDVIENFKLPLRDSFVYRGTDGKLDRIAKIDDLFEMGDFVKIETEVGVNRYIRSTISAPIFIKETFFGAINVDSVEVNGFDENDVKMMAFIRNQVESAISSHLLYQEKTYLSRYDSLTGLYNRYYFEESFSNQKKYADRYATSFQVVLFDMNGLKKINDIYGHMVGDEVLTTYAEYCKRFIRKSDILARFGGDEFVGLFFESDARALESRLTDLLNEFKRNPMDVSGQEVIVSFSFGVSSYGVDGTELTTLLKIADQRMYAAKKLYKKEQVND